MIICVFVICENDVLLLNFNVILHLCAKVSTKLNDAHVNVIRYKLLRD